MPNWLEDPIGNIGNFISGGQQKKAGDFAQQAADTLKGVDLPQIEQMKLQLEDLVSQGILTPEDAQVYLQDPSSFNGITTDPRFNQAQMDALSSLKGISDSGGMTDADTANLSQIASDEASRQRGSREAILQNAQARGLGGSGIELLSQMQNQQDSATRQNQRDLDVAGMAQQRALQALQSAGQLGGQMQAQEFGQKAQIAGANDAINEFNTQNQNSIGLSNTGTRNNAQAANLTAAQNLANTNVANRNDATKINTQYNANIPQQNFENSLRKAGGVSNALSGQAQNAQQTGGALTNMVGSAIQAGATAFGAPPKAPSDRGLKENIEPFDASKFLDSLTSYKYNYKNPDKFGEGKFAGPMAQDLEKTPEGSSLVEETPEGKMVDYGKGFGTILAALTDVHDRVKNLEGGR